MKKPPSKVAHNQPPTFFYVLAWLSKRTIKIPLMQDWVFKLGLKLRFQITLQLKIYWLCAYFPYMVRISNQIQTSQKICSKT